MKIPHNSDHPPPFVGVPHELFSERLLPAKPANRRLVDKKCGRCIRRQITRKIPSLENLHTVRSHEIFIDDVRCHGPRGLARNRDFILTQPVRRRVVGGRHIENVRRAQEIVL